MVASDYPLHRQADKQVTHEMLCLDTKQDDRMLQKTESSFTPVHSLFVGPCHLHPNTLYYVFSWIGTPAPELYMPTFRNTLSVPSS